MGINVHSWWSGCRSSSRRPGSGAGPWSPVPTRRRAPSSSCIRRPGRRGFCCSRRSTWSSSRCTVRGRAPTCRRRCRRLLRSLSEAAVPVGSSVGMSRLPSWSGRRLHGKKRCKNEFLRLDLRRNPNEEWKLVRRWPARTPGLKMVVFVCPRVAYRQVV